MDMPEKLKKIFEKKDKRTGMQKEVDKILGRMAEIDDPTNEEYRSLMVSLDHMVDTKSKDERKTDGPQLDPNTIVTALALLIGMTLTLGHEDSGHVVYSRAFNFLTKFRL